MPEQILTTEYSEEMQRSYLNYSMSVITARAIPDIRDGLKPVQRRVLFDMNELHVYHDRPTLKSARICGDTMGKYHPHGDASIYDTLVVMAQDFKKMQPLVQGQGNFGSIEGDSAAAPRYTEARLTQFSDEVFLRDIERTVRFQPNYDEKLMEPEVLPARIPNFLLNGADGIAVGMTTNVPPHNLGELIDLIQAYLKNPNMEVEEMLHYLPGPDFPTGGIIANKSELTDIYRSGTGKLKLRGKLVFEKAKKRGEKDLLVVTEIPYTMIGAGIGKFMQDVADLCEAKKLPEVTDISNQSDKNGIRIVLELKNGADIERITNILYKKTRLEDTFGVNMLAIAEGRPELLNLRSVLREYLKFQHEIIENKYTNLLERETDRREVQEGLIKACDVIDAIIALLRSCRNLQDAKQALMTGDLSGIQLRNQEFAETIRQFSFTDRQAQAILDMRLYKLIGLELMQLQKEYRETLRKIKEYKAILSSKARANDLLSEELAQIRTQFAAARKTLIEDGREAVYDESAVAEMDVTYVQDKFGYCRLLDKATYERNREAVDSENRYVIRCKNTDRLLLFTDKGNMHQIKLMDVPLCRFKDKGTPIDNLSKYSANEEEIVAALIKSDLAGKMLVFATRFAMIKRVDSGEFDTNNRLVSATKLAEGDALACVRVLSDEKDAVLRTESGYFLRLPTADIPLLKKGSKGVAGIKLSKLDTLTEVYLLTDAPYDVELGGRTLRLNRLNYGTRGTKGTKPR